MSVPYVTKIIIDRAIIGDRRELLLPLVGLLVMAGFIKALGVGGRRYFAFLLSYRAETDLRNRIFEHMQRQAFAFHDRVPTGELMSRSSSDLSQVRLVFAMLPITVANLGMFVVVIAVMVSLDPLLGALVSLSIPLLLFIANAYAKRVIHISWEVQQKLADLSAVVEEAVTGMRVVKAYGQEEQEAGRLAGAAEQIFDRSMALIRHRAVFIPMFEAVAPLATAVILAVGGLRLIDGVLDPGEFVAFTEYMVILNFPLRITGWFFAELPRAAAAGSRVVDLLRRAPDIEDSKHPQQPPP
ncbi:MAG: ABC transporter ATP-binding protein, partial [Acidimicrobiia bacterium]|nr:ABC transporter ATP-binding protein [Acidimicrobiia bacterium]